MNELTARVVERLNTIRDLAKDLVELTKQPSGQFAVEEQVELRKVFQGFRDMAENHLNMLLKDGGI
jgi:hypothetical protein